MSLRLAALAGGWLSCAILAGLCLFLWGRWDHAVQQGRIDVAAANQAAAETKAHWEADKGAATDAYAQRTNTLQPIIIGSTQKADAYAQTDAGRAPCLGVDRVQSILADRAAVFAVTAGGGARPVPAGGDPAVGTGER